MSLRELVEKYLAAAGGYGKSVSIAALGLSREETERVFDILDEDYHISRFFHFTEAGGEKYSINGESATHVAIDPEITSIL